MSRSRTFRPWAGLAATLILAGSAVLAQPPAPPSIPLTVAPTAPAPVVTEAPPATAPEAPALPPQVQVVRFQGPEGLKVDVLGPNPEPVPVGDNHGIATVGLRVGTAYRLRLSNLPERPGAELFPVIEVVGHLHRPNTIDPGKYPIRVVFTQEDLDDVNDHGRLVTQVVYLEDPELALPISLPKDEIPIVNLNPAEEPLKVAAALGRVMAIVRMGGRRPTPEEATTGMYGPPAMPGGIGPCPFTHDGAARCPVACGPACGAPPPPGMPWLPKDEYLCDGGDHGEAAHFGGDGGLRGINPRDAVVRFDDGRRPRALPTNMVCIYAPRFAEVRVAVGPNEALLVEAPLRTKLVQKEALEAARQGPRRMVRNQGAELARVRERPSGLAADVRPGIHSDQKAAVAYDQAAHIAVAVKPVDAELARTRAKAMLAKERERPVGIKTAESAIVTGRVASASAAVMTWTPRETVGVETPPNRPGLAVIKRVSAGEAEAGEVVTFVIQYRNMGNTPIHDVTIVDSLLPRLGFVPGSSRGPKGTTFTVDDNVAGSTELKWVLPGPVPPGVEGHVSFQAVVR
jgi:uncharacterized repeat protein (TIGR01451 family)